jgi:hypothetical protein
MTRVCVLPYRQKLGLRPSRLLLKNMEWPLGRPDGLDDQTLGDLTEDDHLLVPARKAVMLRPKLGTRAKVSVFFMEPRAIHGKYMAWLLVFHRGFHRILTGDAQLLQSLPNAVLFPLGGSWVTDWASVDTTKHRMCSLIASEKAKQTGHKLRHAVVAWVRATGQDVEIMGRGYRPFAEKAEGLAPFRYSIVIENSREPNYFTEKLIDAMLCNTIPIYWGCPNIGEFFDTSGMILCQSLGDIQAAVQRLSPEDFQARQAAAVENRARAAAFATIQERAARTVLEADRAEVTGRP